MRAKGNDVRSADDALDDAKVAADHGDADSALAFVREATENAGGRLSSRLQKLADEICSRIRFSHS
ncbi:hypothetical protein KC930_00700 [Candidatus Saccharibacteria bacterium]|nr:hypothetical protein [Candidatus Saccharibacteria bacterium]